MQQVVFTIQDPRIEQAIIEITRKKKMNIQELMLQAIQSFVGESLHEVRILDPLEHSTQIHYSIDEDVQDAKPFALVDDSARFGKELREAIWRGRQHE